MPLEEFAVEFLEGPCPSGVHVVKALTNRLKRLPLLLLGGVLVLPEGQEFLQGASVTPVGELGVQEIPERSRVVRSVSCHRPHSRVLTPQSVPPFPDLSRLDGASLSGDLTL